MSSICNSFDNKNQASLGRRMGFPKSPAGYGYIFRRLFFSKRLEINLRCLLEQRSNFGWESLFVAGGRSRKPERKLQYGFMNKRSGGTEKTQPALPARGGLVAIVHLLLCHLLYNTLHNLKRVIPTIGRYSSEHGPEENTKRIYRLASSNQQMQLVEFRFSAWAYRRGTTISVDMPVVVGLRSGVSKQARRGIDRLMTTEWKGATESSQS
ncbi:hypothetical protein KCU81_g22, partial [Aureobasidium melanogenum]